MKEAGIRFDPKLYVAFQLDPDQGDMFVSVEIRNDDGVLQVITGTVTWDE